MSRSSRPSEPDVDYLDIGANDLPTRPNQYALPSGGRGGARSESSGPDRDAVERVNRAQRGLSDISKRFQDEQAKMFEPLLDRIRQSEMREMFLCSVRCTEEKTSFEKTQACAQACSVPFQKKMHEIQAAGERVAQQMNGCVQECTIPLQSSMQKGGPSEKDVDDLFRCASDCFEDVDFKRQEQRLTRILWPN